jgi:hypothetical protein
MIVARRGGGGRGGGERQQRGGESEALLHQAVSPIILLFQLLPKGSRRAASG